MFGWVGRGYLGSLTSLFCCVCCHLHLLFRASLSAPLFIIAYRDFLSTRSLSWKPHIPANTNTNTHEHIHTHCVNLEVSALRLRNPERQTAMSCSEHWGELFPPGLRSTSGLSLLCSVQVSVRSASGSPKDAACRRQFPSPVVASGRRRLQLVHMVDHQFSRPAVGAKEFNVVSVCSPCTCYYPKKKE